MMATLSQKVRKIRDYCSDNDIWYLKSHLQFPKESLNEVLQVYNEGYFVRHRGSDSEGWLSCAIHGWGTKGKAEWHRTMNPSGYGFTEEEVQYGWTELEEICPRTKEFLQDNFDTSKMRRARFMLLEPNGNIKEHTDGEGRNIYSAINVAITQPENCYLRRTDTLEEVPFQPYEMYYYDNRVPHEAKNNSTENRFHFIIHGYSNEQGYNNFIKSFENEYSSTL